MVGSLHGHIESLKRSGGNKIPVFSCLVVISNESVGGLEGAPGVKTLVCLSSPSPCLAVIQLQPLLNPDPAHSDDGIYV